MTVTKLDNHENTLWAEQWNETVSDDMWEQVTDAFETAGYEVEHRTGDVARLFRRMLPARRVDDPTIRIMVPVFLHVALRPVRHKFLDKGKISVEVNWGDGPLTPWICGTWLADEDDAFDRFAKEIDWTVTDRIVEQRSELRIEH